MSKPAATPIQYFSIPQIRERFLPLCRQTLQKMFIGQPGVKIHGRREDADRRKVAKQARETALARFAADPSKSLEQHTREVHEPWRKHRKLLVPLAVVERVLREMMVTVK